MWVSYETINGHPKKDMYVREVGLCVHNMITIVKSSSQHNSGGGELTTSYR